MPEVEGAEGEDAYLKDMKEARDSAAVFKLKLVSLRSSDPTVVVFVFEGVDDKKVYFHWVRRVNADLSYDSLICGGKGTLLKFLSSLRRDRGSARHGVYFFMDRDFDDWRGEQPGPEIFMTQTYSFENVLVGENVLEELLKGELHCHAEPESRTKVIGVFSAQYDAFLACTREVNFRLFVARKLGIEVSSLPEKINLLATVALDSVAPSENALVNLVCLTQEPTDAQSEALRGEFDALHPRNRFRGKFALLFFSRWLRMLIADRNSAESKYFAELRGGEFKAGGEVTLDSLAARADLPEGFAAFIAGVVPPPAAV